MCNVLQKNLNYCRNVWLNICNLRYESYMYVWYNVRIQVYKISNGKR